MLVSAFTHVRSPLPTTGGGGVGFGWGFGASVFGCATGTGRFDSGFVDGPVAGFGSASGTGVRMGAVAGGPGSGGRGGGTSSTMWM